METKPYSIQSPEQIAKDYGGNKQKIAEAMQMGVVDPTAGTLAGMFIDRMRSAQTQEQAPQQTVAQQVFAPPASPVSMGGIGMPASPAPAPMEGAPAGLGATPEAAQMQAPMPEAPAPEMPEMPVEEAPMGMAGGGLTSLPVPNSMFDEPDNGGYADGGLIAFARGGYNDFHKAIIAQESGGRYGVPNAQGSGAMGIGQIMPDTARAIAKRLGLPYRPELLAGDDEASRKYQDALTGAATKEAWDYAKGNPQVAAQYYHAGPNKEGWGPKTQKYGRDLVGRLGMEGTPMPREADTNTAAGRAISAEDAVALGRGMFSDLPRESLDRAKAAALEELDPEKIEKDRKYDMYSALASFGLSLASPDNYKGEGILGSIAKAAKTTMPEFEASRKERKAAKSAAVRELMALEDVDRKTAIAGVEIGMDVYKSGLSAEQAQRAMAFQEKELASRENIATLDRQVTMAAALARQNNPTTFETQLAAYRKSYPGVADVALFKQMRKDGILGSGQTGMALPGMEDTGGAGGDTSGMSIVGSRPVQ